MGKTDANKEGMKGGARKWKENQVKEKNEFIYMEKVGGDESRI